MFVSTVTKMPYVEDCGTLALYKVEKHGKGERDYQSGNAKNTIEIVHFQSPYKTLGDFYNTLNARQSSELVQLCDGGIFAAKVVNIRAKYDVLAGIREGIGEGVTTSLKDITQNEALGA